MRPGGDAPVTVSQLTKPRDRREQMLEDVRIGLTAFHKHLPSMYFYDARGAELFEEITRLPEYYLTPAETEILAESADDLMSRIEPDELVEFGSGSSKKTVMLIEAMRRSGGDRYVPIDISEDALRAAAKELCSTYKWLEIEALVGDYVADSDKVRRRGTRLIVFLGSTIGNYTQTLRHSLFRSVAGSLEPGDHFLLGVDLVKDEATMVKAYDDSAGVRGVQQEHSSSGQPGARWRHTRGSLRARHEVRSPILLHVTVAPRQAQGGGQRQGTGSGRDFRGG